MDVRYGLLANLCELFVARKKGDWEATAERDQQLGAASLRDVTSQLGAVVVWKCGSSSALRWSGKGGAKLAAVLLQVEGIGSREE